MLSNCSSWGFSKPEVSKNRQTHSVQTATRLPVGSCIFSYIGLGVNRIGLFGIE